MIVTHSALPWSASPSFVRVFDASGETLALTYGDDPTCAIDDRLIANTEFIVLACNVHGDLVRELMHALCFVEDAENCSDFKPGVVTARIKSIRAALAKAGAA